MIRTSPIFEIVFVCTLAFLPAAAQQEKQEVSANVTGSMIVMPAKVVAGQRASLAVVDASGRLRPRAVVAFTGGEHILTDATGRLTFTAPAQPGVLLANIPGSGVSASTTVIATPANPGDGVVVVDYPRFVALSDRFVIDGFGFRGDADVNRVTLNDQPALVLAASPVTLVAMPGPRAAEGPAQLLVEVGGRSPGPMPVTLVALELLPMEKGIKGGEKGVLSVRVRGTDQRLTIEARNLSPDIVEMPKGNVQRVSSSGGRDNLAEIEIQGLRRGEYSFALRLVPAPVGLPDVEAARQHLLAAQKIAGKDWQERVSKLIERLERDPQDVPRLRDELERMLAAKPEGELALRLEAAWKELLRR